MKRIMSLTPGRIVMLLAILVLLASNIPVRGSQNAASTVYLPLIQRNYVYVMPVIPETTEVLPEETLQDLAAVSESGVFTFTQGSAALDEVGVGDVIVGDVSAAAPDGFLRRVTSVSSQNGQVILITEQATLEETIQQGSVSLSKRLTPANIHP